MNEIDAVESLLDDLGPHLKLENEKLRLRQFEEAPNFDALSFFKCDEVIASKILAYFITPSFKHGGAETFLRVLLELLAIPVSNQVLNSVVVLNNVPCFTLKEPRFIDILIRFRDSGQEYAIVLESKSHGATDQPGQIREYLEHLTKAYPNSRKYLFYMKDGQPPSSSSITPATWRLALAEGICFAVDYHSLIKRWVNKCSARSQPEKLKDFFNSFLKFTGVEQESAMTVSKQTKDLVAQLIERESANGEISVKVNALIELSLMTDFVWETAIKGCLEKVGAELRKQLPEWRISLCPYLTEESRPRNEFELYLWKAQWKEEDKEDAAVSVFLATWGDSFSLGWFKREDVQPLPGMKFNKQGHFNLSRSQRVYPASHIGDIRSAEGVRYLLTDQAAMDLVNDIMGFIADHELKMNESVSGILGHLRERNNLGTDRRFP